MQDRTVSLASKSALTLFANPSAQPMDYVVDYNPWSIPTNLIRFVTRVYLRRVRALRNAANMVQRNFRRAVARRDARIGILTAVRAPFALFLGQSLPSRAFISMMRQRNSRQLGLDSAPLPRIGSWFTGSRITNTQVAMQQAPNWGAFMM